MTALTKQEAATLWGNGFKLRYTDPVEPEQTVDYSITNLTEDEYETVILELDGEVEISALEIGQDYFIIARPPIKS